MPSSSEDQRSINVTYNFVKTRGVKFETFEAGSADGPVVVLKHGAGSSVRIWEAVQELLVDEGFHKYVVETYGAGGNDHTPDEAGYAHSNYAVDLMAMVDALGVGRFTLVGHPLGTLTAKSTARDHRDQLEALVPVAGPHPDGVPAGGRTLGCSGD